MTNPDFDRRRFVTGVSGALAVGLAGCLGGDESDDQMTDEEMTDQMTDEGGMAGSSLTFAFDGLPELAAGHYEGWAVFGDEKVSTGTFSAGDEYAFEVDRDLTDADRIVVTIEPDDDMDGAPSGVVLLAGAVESGTAELSFPVSFDMVGGSYILATPTNGGGTNETAGVWFLDPSGPSASLSLPELPRGWAYEGWVLTQGTPLSTGRFRDPAAADGFDGYSGMADAPPFPGEDFLANAPDGVDFPVDLADGASEVVVSVEPDVDGTDPTGPAPFAIKPLAGAVPEGADDHTPYDLSANEGTVPGGTATIE